MRVTVELRRPARGSATLVLVGLLLLTPAVVIASHQFPDAPTGHPFHDQISAIAKAGITAGFSDGTYRPSDPVTRQAMAAFMERGFGRVGLAIGGPTLTPSLSVGASIYDTDLMPVRALTIMVPGASNTFGPQQLVHLHGRVVLESAMSVTIKGCPCQFSAVIRDMTTGLASLPHHQVFESSSGNLWFYAFDVEAVFTAAPGPHTYRLEAALDRRDTGASAAAFGFHHESSLSAETFPFDASPPAE